MFLVNALNELRVSSVGVELLLSDRILWNNGGRNSDLYPNSTTITDRI